MSGLCQREIRTTDRAKSTKFYAARFGPKMQSWSGDYAMFEIGGGITQGQSNKAN